VGIPHLNISLRNFAWLIVSYVANAKTPKVVRIGNDVQELRVNNNSECSRGQSKDTVSTSEQTACTKLGRKSVMIDGKSTEIRKENLPNQKSTNVTAAVTCYLELTYFILFHYYSITSLRKLNYAGDNGVIDRRENRRLIQSASEETFGYWTIT